MSITASDSKEMLRGMNEVTCLTCGWVSFGVSKEYAEAEVDKFNKWFDTQSEETQSMFSGHSSVENYRCLICGGVKFRPYIPGDCPDGCTLNPVIYEENK